MPVGPKIRFKCSSLSHGSGEVALTSRSVSDARDGLRPHRVLATSCWDDGGLVVAAWWFVSASDDCMVRLLEEAWAPGLGLYRGPDETGRQNKVSNGLSRVALALGGRGGMGAPTWKHILCISTRLKLRELEGLIFRLSLSRAAGKLVS